jgi:hypothetical protein
MKEQRGYNKNVVFKIWKEKKGDTGLEIECLSLRNQKMKF